jgi:hypothetical protein
LTNLIFKKYFKFTKIGNLIKFEQFSKFPLKNSIFAELHYFSEIFSNNSNLSLKSPENSKINPKFPQKSSKNSLNYISRVDICSVLAGTVLVF